MTTLKILEGKEIKNFTNELDLKTNRNAKMIQTLLRRGVNGVFLFYTHKDDVSIDQGFMLPPGLTDEQIEQFKFEFMNLFERYAKVANKGRK